MVMEREPAVSQPYIVGTIHGLDCLPVRAQRSRDTRCLQSVKHWGSSILVAQESGDWHLGLAAPVLEESVGDHLYFAGNGAQVSKSVDLELDCLATSNGVQTRFRHEIAAGHLLVRRLLISGFVESLCVRLRCHGGRILVSAVCRRVIGGFVLLGVITGVRRGLINVQVASHTVVVVIRVAGSPLAAEPPMVMLHMELPHFPLHCGGSHPKWLCNIADQHAVGPHVRLLAEALGDRIQLVYRHIRHGSSLRIKRRGHADLMILGNTVNLIVNLRVGLVQGVRLGHHPSIFHDVTGQLGLESHNSRQK
mmetsp:Transcript_52835/g.140483  ORF Transcript_52835/g.140483 Transcript_52835/m.140483 type:complete len:307 (-) Transcript_52835:175-1095(-)